MVADSRPNPGAAMKQDFEMLAVIVSVALVLAMASLVTTLPEWRGVAAVAPAVLGYSMPESAHDAPLPADMAPKTPESTDDGLRQAFRDTMQVPQSELERRVGERFEQAVALLHAQQYEYAITALDSVLAMAPKMPEAYVNMGYAFLGLKEYGPARGAFEKALELKVDQVNAYYGLAEAFEGMKDYEGALGAMRSYIHLSPPDDPFLAKARAALWEWEAELGRIKGVEPAPEGMPVPTEADGPKWSEGHKGGQ
jgi:tetratricopeptide (TPR) repeat protein